MSNWEDNIICISVVEAKRVTHRVKNIYTLVFLQYQYDNGIFIPKYDKSVIVTAFMWKTPDQVPLSSKS